MADSISKVKVETPFAGPQMNLNEPEKAVLRDHAIRAARALQGSGRRRVWLQDIVPPPVVVVGRAPTRATW